MKFYRAFSVSASQVSFIAFLALAVPSQVVADPLLVSASGTYNGATPSSFFTAPNEAWSLSFLLQTTPSVSNASFGVGFSPSFTDFNYLLNGSLVAITPDDIRFWAVPKNTPFILGLSVCWTSSCVGGTTEGIAFDTQQLYTGSELSPTIVPGTYPTSEFFIDNVSSFGEPNTVVTIALTPEPSMLLLSVIGLVALAVVVQARRAKDRVRT